MLYKASRKSRSNPSLSLEARRFRARRRGVSEILGTILILSLTVVLFSSIFYFVSTLPTPAVQSTSQFNPQLGVSAGGTEAYLNISYVAGPLLTNGATEIFLSSSVHPNNFGCARFGSYGDPYTLSQGMPGAATTWASGQVWSLPLQIGTTVCPGGNLAAAGDNVTISILDIQTNTLLLHVTLPGTTPNPAPLFLRESTSPANPVVGTSFVVNAVIRSNLLVGDSVYASFLSLGITTPLQMTLSGTTTPATAATVSGTNTWTVSVAASLIPPTVTIFPGQPYNYVLNATDTLGHTNSVVSQVSFVSPAATAYLKVTLGLSDGSPRVNENVTVSAAIDNTGGGAATGLTAIFRSSVSGFLGSASINTTLGAGVTLTPPPVAYWRATGSAGGKIGDGAVTLWVWVNGTSGSAAVTAYDSLGVTVFPRTLLIDETGVTPGVNGSLDTFTYVANDFNSADIPFNVTTVTPGSSLITYFGSGPNALDRYDVIVWVLSNDGYLSCSDVGALASAIQQGQRSVWVLGANALWPSSSFPASCDSQLDILWSYFGVGSMGGTTTMGGPEPLQVNTGTPIPTTSVDNGNLWLSPYLDGYKSQQTYRFITPTPASPVGSNVYIREGSYPAYEDLATYATLSGKGIASPFELAAVSQEMPNGTSAYVDSMGQQSAIVYGAFNWLSNFSALTPVRQGNDWAVSQVTVQPIHIAYRTPVFVNYTVRNNGPSLAAIPVALYVNGAEAYELGSPVVAAVSPSTLGGVVNGSFEWTPTFVGFLTVSVVITPPASDADLSNNQMGNSLFSEQLYVHYNVLLIDATAGATTDTTPIVYAALNATGYPAGTVTETKLTSACAPVSPLITISLYNLVIWNAGDKNNATGAGPCVLTPTDALELAGYLGNGGSTASLLFIGGGVLTETNPTVVSFVQQNLGVTGGAILSSAPSSTLFGGNGDPVGDGLALPYAGAACPNACYGISSLTSSSIVAKASLYYNQKDYWTPAASPEIAASDGFSVSSGWTTAFWAFSLQVTGDSSQLNLLMLRASTFFGRVLPTADVVVSPPETTFSTSTSPWQNFDEIHPQIDEQNLIRINVTNLGGVAAFSIGVNVLDGNHILQATSVTVGPASFTAGVGTSAGVAQLSVPWTPIYAGQNAITVQLVSGLSGETLPSVGSTSSWNLTVYFFYDTSNGNSNSWTHSQTVLQQTNISPTACAQQPTGNAALWGQINVPVQWPLEKAKHGASCSYAQKSTADVWGMNTTSCFLTQPFCASLSIGDSNTCGGGCSSVTWAYSSNVTIPAGISSATATWWQMYNLATSADGGIVCIVPQSDYPLPHGSTNGESGNILAILDTVFNTCQTQNPPSPGYSSPQAPGLLDDYAGACNYLGSFSGSSLGGSGGWEQENLNLSAFAGQTVSVAFGYVAGTLQCGGTASVQPGNGWNIDDFSVQVSGGPTSAVAQTSAACQTGDPGANISPDVWQQSSTASLAATLTALGASNAPTGGAWVAGANSGGIYTLNPNMWDSLYSRPIDLSNALNATINFNYLWSNVFWVYFDTGGFQGPPWDYGMSPQQDFILEVAPAVSTSVTPWVQIWSANNWSSYSNGYDSHYVGHIAGSSGGLYGGEVAVSSEGWNKVSISLNAYAGEVIRLRFLVGTNCGFNSLYASFNYPMLSSATGAALPSGAFLSGVNITGATVIPPGVPAVAGGGYLAAGGPSAAWNYYSAPASAQQNGARSGPGVSLPLYAGLVSPGPGTTQGFGVDLPTAPGLARWE